MAMTASKMQALGAAAPDFQLKNTEGSLTQLSDFNGAKGLVVMFICNHCPYVIHIAPKLAEIAQHYMTQGIGFVAINSNDTDAYPADNFDNMIKEKASRGYVFPYLLDEDQSIAKAYLAACTPDIYLFDDAQKLVYRGQFDGSRPYRISSGNYDDREGGATGEDLTAAMDKLLEGDAITTDQKPSLGCNIKWKPSNEPSR